MTVSDSGLDLIEEFEGFRSSPYLDSAGVATIGIGSTFYENGTSVTMNDESITRERARDLLRIVAHKFAQSVDDLTRPINQNQFDALVSFTYNVGVYAFRNSTLLKKVNSNPCDESISYEFSRWKRAGGRVLQGLINRRKKEAELYFK